METGLQFKVSFERPEKQGINLVIPGLVVQHVIQYSTATSRKIGNVAEL